MTTRLIYTGRGDMFYNVPARDLTDEDFAERAEVWQEFGITEKLLIDSGLYKPFEEKPTLAPARRSAGETTKKAAKDGE
jgi:hypothetical protein